jgi:hypothetical protein
MMDHLASLRADGFVLLARRRVALAHFIWYVELEVEQERALRLVEETILRLIAAGVDHPDRIAELMGLDESNIVPDAIGDLLRKSALRHDQGVLHVSAGGSAVLSKMALRETARSEERLHHDPYRNRIALVGAERDHLSDSERRSMGVPGLPIPRELTRTELQNRHLDVQLLLTERAKRAETSAATAVELLRVLPAGAPHFIWEEADVEVWHHETDDARWDWRILVDGVEDDVVRARLRELEDDSADVIPLDEASNNTEASSVDGLLSDLFDGGSPVAGGLGAREAAVGRARAIAFIGPSGAMGANDVHLLAGIAERLEADVERVQIATTWSATAKRSGMADPTLALVDRLIAVAPAKVTAREAPSLAHSVLTLDGERAFVTRYRWSAFHRRPNRGLWWPEVRAVDVASVTAITKTLGFA